MPHAVKSRSYRKRKPTTRRPRRHGTKSKFGNPRSLAPIKGNYARIVETVEYEGLQPNTMYNNLVQLQDFSRALAIAPDFQWYRITEVKYTYEPLWNTFQQAQGSVPGTSVPQFNYIMNRAGTFLASDLEGLQTQGCKPTKFTSNKIIKYKPNTLVTSGYAGTDGSAINIQANELKMNAWLPTNHPITTNDPTLVPYYGHQLWIDQLDPPTGATSICKLTISIVVEFKDPAIGNGIRAPVGTLVKKE